jgi:hypothetical protein
MPPITVLLGGTIIFTVDALISFKPITIIQIGYFFGFLITLSLFIFCLSLTVFWKRFVWYYVRQPSIENERQKLQEWAKQYCDSLFTYDKTTNTYKVNEEVLWNR